MKLTLNQRTFELLTIRTNNMNSGLQVLLMKSSKFDGINKTNKNIIEFCILHIKIMITPSANYIMDTLKN